MKNNFLWIFVFCINFLSYSNTINADNTRRQYIEQYKDIAIRDMKSYGIPASITLAQACLESNNGNSVLATKGNNHFGIKCHNWSGATIKHNDDKRNECFRKYKNVRESYQDHCDFLRYSSRYSSLFDLPLSDYKGWAYGLKAAGYATDPTYPKRLISIIEQYNLQQYDEIVIGKNKKFHNIIPPTPNELKAAQVYKPLKQSYFYKYNRNRILYKINRTVFILSKEGDTYKDIANEYNLFLKEILRFNDLKENHELLPGTKVYLESKQAKAARHLDYHIAEKGDTYYGLSQKYAVRIDKIIKYNHLSFNSILYPGDKVYLRRQKNEK